MPNLHSEEQLDKIPLLDKFIKLKKAATKKYNKNIGPQHTKIVPSFKKNQITTLKF